MSYAFRPFWDIIKELHLITQKMYKDTVLRIQTNQLFIQKYKNG